MTEAGRIRNIPHRPRRNRSSRAMRSFVAEARVGVDDLIQPFFVIDGENQRVPVTSMPGVNRLSVDLLVEECRRTADLGIGSVALFPVIADSLKTPHGEEALNPDGLLLRTIRILKAEVPELLLFTDVALDPYSSDGHDGIVEDGRILNDETLEVLARMAVVQAEAGADIVAPSDMMDGRVGAIRTALDDAGCLETAICSYCVKYASAFYGPFRDALDSAPRAGDKKTYQMDPRNAREALREIRLDETEGADWLMVKPGLPYLDVVRLMRESTTLPVAVYHVSGEYAMLKAAAQNGWLDYEKCLVESLTGFKRAGADVILTYGAMDAARLLAAAD